MGEIADSLINGEMDFYTGEYIGKGNGFPRTLDNSLPWEKRKPRVMIKGIKNNQLFGILNWVANHSNVEMIGNPQEYAQAIMRTYGSTILKTNIGDESLAQVIQSNFTHFTKWVYSTYISK